jgi:hypothetical protein
VDLKEFKEIEGFKGFKESVVLRDLKVKLESKD